MAVKLLQINNKAFNFVHSIKLKFFFLIPQNIPHTNFPLQELKLYAELCYLMTMEAAHNSSHFHFTIHLYPFPPPKKFSLSHLLLAPFFSMPRQCITSKSLSKSYNTKTQHKHNSNHFHLTQRMNKEWAEATMLHCML